MSSAASNPRLRLVGVDGGDWLRQRRERQEVIRENRAAGRDRSLEPTDPRWVLAVRAYAGLEGTALTPERRERVMRTARHLGVRPFDANVIIAIVQDHARRGEDLAEAAPTLTLLRRPAPRPAALSWTWMRWAAAVGTALAANAILIWWLLS